MSPQIAGCPMCQGWNGIKYLVSSDAKGECISMLTSQENALEIEIARPCLFPHNIQSLDKM